MTGMRGVSGEEGEALKGQPPRGSNFPDKESRRLSSLTFKIGERRRPTTTAGGGYTGKEYGGWLV